MNLFADVSTLLSTYALGYDTKNPALVGECFEPDAWFELVLPDGSTTLYQGREAIVDFMAASLQGQEDTRRHFTTNLRVIATAKDSAEIGCYLLLGAIDGHGLRIVQSGRYNDHISWSAGTAKFISRRLEMDGTF